jgi:peptidoglycan/xylan/chitin deacetylase (PgdA/CDA1 family)
VTVLKALLLAAAGASGISTVVGASRWRRSRLLILCYHGVSLGDEHEAMPELYIPPEQFRRRLVRLRERRCHVLPLGDALARLHAGTLPPRSVALTFDDGTQDFAERAAPLLREFDVPATVYLATYYCGRGQPVFDTALRYLLWRGRGSGADLADLAAAPGPLRLVSERDVPPAWHALYGHARDEAMGADAKDALLQRVADRVGVDYAAFAESGMFQVMTPEQVRGLPRDLVEVQLHTHRHRVPRDRDALAREIADNRAHLRRLGVEYATEFCYPNGDYRSDAARWLREVGVESAVTCVPGLATRDSDPMLLPRFVDSSVVPDATFDAWLSGVGSLLPRRRMNRLDPDRLRDGLPGPPAPVARRGVTTPSWSSAAGSP